MSNESSTAEPQPLFAKKPAGAPKEGGSSNTNLGLIFGICAGVAAVIAIIVVLIIVLAANSGKSITCETTKTDTGVEEVEKQIGAFTVNYDKDEKLVSATMYEETYYTRDITDEEFETGKKSFENFNKDNYKSVELTKKSNRVIRMDVEFALNDQQKANFETIEKTKKYAETLNFTCKD